MTCKSSWLLAAILTVSLSACTVGRPFFPIKDSNQRFEFEGFSFLPPSGIKWGAFGREFPSVPFAMMKDTGKRYHTVVATAEVAVLDEETVEQKKGNSRKLLEYVAQQSIDTQLRMDWKIDRFSLVEFKKKATIVDGNSCLSWSFKFEDRGVPGKKGVLFNFEGESLACLHPDSPSLAVLLQYSERYRADTSPPLHFQEGRRFLSSLTLTLMNYTIKAIRVGRRPQIPAFGHGSVWVSSGKDNTVYRIDPKINKIQAKVTVGGNPIGIIAVPGGVWVANARSGTLSFINAESNAVTSQVDVGGRPRMLGNVKNTVMICNSPEAHVSFMDGQTGAIVDKTGLGNLGSCGQVGPEYWTSIGGKVYGIPIGTIIRIDPAKREISGRILFVPGKALSFLLHKKIVWVTFADKGIVAGIDPVTEDTLFKISTGPRPVYLALFQDTIWVSDFRSGNLVRIDPQSKKVVEKPFPIGLGSSGMLVSNGSLWVSKVHSGQLLRITPK